MTDYEYDIAKETFCIYCQRRFESFLETRKHVLKFHADTYAESNLIKRLKELEGD